ncbi:MAG: PilN domain-containing protein [Kiritimatiellia bacterium]|jgi:Tfp pilus assembly protein PilN
MKQNATGIAFDGRSVSWARLDRARDAVASGDAGAIPGAPSPTAFEAPEAYEAALADFGRRVAEKTPDTCTLALPTRDLIFRSIHLPSADLDEIRAMARNQVEKDSPFPIEEMVASFEILEQTQDAALVLCAAAPLRAVETARIATGADPARIERVDAAALGLLRSLADSFEAAPSPGARDILLLDEGGAITLMIVDSGRPMLIRAAGEAQTASKTDLTRLVRIALIQTASEHGALPLGRLVVATGEDALRAAATAAATAVSCPVVSLSKPRLPSPARGVALRTLEDRRLDLFPDDWRERLAERKFRKTFRTGVIAAAAVWALFAGYLFGWPLLLDQRIKALDAEVQRLAPDEEKVNDIRTRIRIIGRYSDRTFSPMEALLEVSNAMPPGIELAAFRYNGARRQVTIEGRAGMSTIVYDFMDNLKRSAIFASNKLVSGPTLNRNLGVNVFELSIDFKTSEELEGNVQ